MAIPRFAHKAWSGRAHPNVRCSFDPLRGVLLGAVVVGAVRSGALLERESDPSEGDPEQLYPPMLAASRRVIARTVPAHLRDEAESVANEAIAEAIDRWQPGSDPGALAFVTVRARVIDFLRKEGGRRSTGAGREPTVSLSTGGCELPLLDELTGVADPVGDHAERIVVRDGMRRLTKRQRLVLYRRFFEGRRYTEISEEIGVLPSRVHEIGQEALRKLGVHIDNPRPLPRRAVAPTEPSGDESGAGVAQLLSERERAVLEAAAEGLSAEETATRFGRGVETIKAQRRAVIRKLGAANIMNAIHIAHRLGVLA